MRNRFAFVQLRAAAGRKGALALCLGLFTLGLGHSAKAQNRKATIITFNAPGAGTGSGQGTFPLAINPAGTITGFYADASNVYHGFLRAPDGTITAFEAPGAGTFQGTLAYSINPGGAITGLYVDASNVDHGFLRARDGTFTTFDAPGAGTGPGQGTIPLDNNPADAITGVYIDASGLYHGFLQTR